MPGTDGEKSRAIPRRRKMPFDGIDLTEEKFNPIPVTPSPGVVDNFDKVVQSREALRGDLSRIGLSDDNAGLVVRNLATGKLKPEDLQGQVELMLRHDRMVNERDIPEDPRSRTAQQIREATWLKAGAAFGGGLTDGERSTLKRKNTPNITVTYEVDDFTGPSRGMNFGKTQRVTIRNFDPKTGDLTEMPEIPAGARVIDRKEEKFEGDDSRMKALKEYERQRIARAAINEAAIMFTQLTPEEGPLPPAQSFVEVEKEVEKENAAKSRAFDKERTETARLLMRTLPFGLGVPASFVDGAAEQVGKVFIHKDPVKAYLDPKTPHERAFSFLVDGTILALTKSPAGLGVKSVLTAPGRAAIRAGLKGALSGGAKEVAKRAAQAAGKSLSLKGIGRAAVAGARTGAQANILTKGFDAIPVDGEDAVFTPDEAKRYIARMFPNVYSGWLGDDEALELAHALQMQARASATNELLGQIMPDPLRKVVRGAIDAQYYLAQRESLFGGNNAAEILLDHAPRMIASSYERDGDGSFVSDIDSYVKDYQKEVEEWNSEDLDDMILHGVGFSTAIMGPFRKIIGAAGLKAQNTLAATKAAVRYASGLRSSARATLGKELRKELGVWGAGGLKSLGLSAAVGMATRGAGVYAKGDRIHDRMIRDGYTPGQAFTTAFLVPWLNESIEFASEAMFIPELGFNFGRGVMRRIGTRLLMTLNPYEAMEEGLGRYMTYGAEEAFGVPDDYRQQKELPYFGSNGLKEAVGDLAITTISSLLVGMKGLRGGARRGAVNIGNMLRDGNEKHMNMMRAALVTSGMDKNAVEKLDRYDLQTEFLALKYDLGERERKILRNMIEQNVFGIANDDAASLLGGNFPLGNGKTVRLGGVEALAQGLGFRNDQEFSSYLAEVNEEWDVRKRPWLYTPENAPEMFKEQPAEQSATEQPAAEQPADAPASPATGSDPREAPPMPTEAPPLAEGEEEASAPVSAEKPAVEKPASDWKGTVSNGAYTPRVPYSEQKLSDLKREWSLLETEDLPEGDLRKKETWAAALEETAQMKRPGLTQGTRPAPAPVPDPTPTPTPVISGVSQRLLDAIAATETPEEIEDLADEVINSGLFDEEGNISESRPMGMVSRSADKPIPEKKKRKKETIKDALTRVSNTKTFPQTSSVKRSGAFFTLMFKNAARDVFKRMSASSSFPTIEENARAIQDKEGQKELSSLLKLSLFGATTPEQGLINAKRIRGFSVDSRQLSARLEQTGRSDLAEKIRDYTKNNPVRTFGLPVGDPVAALSNDLFALPNEDKELIEGIRDELYSTGLRDAMAFIDKIPAAALARLQGEFGDQRALGKMDAYMERISIPIGNLLSEKLRPSQGMVPTGAEDVSSDMKELVDLAEEYSSMILRPQLAMRKFMEKHPELGLKDLYHDLKSGNTGHLPEALTNTRDPYEVLDIFLSARHPGLSERERKALEADLQDSMFEAMDEVTLDVAGRLREDPRHLLLMDYILTRGAKEHAIARTNIRGAKIVAWKTATPETIIHELAHFLTQFARAKNAPEAFLVKDITNIILDQNKELRKVIEDNLRGSGYEAHSFTDEHLARMTEAVMSTLAHSSSRGGNKREYHGNDIYSFALEAASKNEEVISLIKARIAEYEKLTGKSVFPAEEKRSIWEMFMDAIRELWQAAREYIGLPAAALPAGDTRGEAFEMFRAGMDTLLRETSFNFRVEAGATESWEANIFTLDPSGKPVYKDLWDRGGPQAILPSKPLGTVSREPDPEQPDGEPSYRVYRHGQVETSVSPHAKSVETEMLSDIHQTVKSAVRPGVRAEVGPSFRDRLIQTVGRYREGQISPMEGVLELATGINTDDPTGYLPKKIGWSLLHTWSQRQFQMVVTPSVAADGQVHLHTDVVLSEPPIASSVGDEKEMMAHYRFVPLDGELDTAYVRIDGGNIYIADKTGHRREMPLGRVASLMEKEGDHQIVSPAFTNLMEAMASQGFYYLGPAGRNNTFMFLALNPDSVAQSGDALEALVETEKALGITGSDRTARIRANKATPEDLLAMVQSSFGVWLDSPQWATNPEKFYKYANTFASQEKVGDPAIVRELFSAPDITIKLLEESDLSPEEKARTAEAMRTLFVDNGEGPRLNVIAPAKPVKEIMNERPTDDWSIADRLFKEGWELVRGGIAVKQKNGQIKEIRTVSILTSHPWYIHETEGYVTKARMDHMIAAGAPASSFAVVGDGASLNTPVASVVADMSMGQLTGRVKIEKPRILQPGAKDRLLLFKGQFQIASGPMLEWMEKNGVGKIIYSSTVKRGKDQWAYANPDSLLSGGNAPVDSLLLLNSSSVSQAGTGELHEGHDTSFVLQSLIANGFNSALFPSSEPLVATLAEHFRERSKAVRDLFAILEKNSIVRMAMTRIGLSRQTGEPTVYGLTLDALLNAGSGTEHLSQLPHFSAMTRHLAHKEMMRGLFDPSSSSGGARTPGSSAFLTADEGLGGETMMSVLRANKGSDPAETLMKYFEVDDVLDVHSVSPFTDALVWKKREKGGEEQGAESARRSPREDLIRKAVVKEAYRLVEDVMEAAGLENRELAILQFERNGIITDIEREALRNVMRAQGYTRIETPSGKVLYARGPGFLREEIEIEEEVETKTVKRKAVPVVVGRNVATNSGLKVGDRCMAIAIPTDAPHSASAAIVVGISNMHQVVTVSPMKVSKTGKDHDGDALIIYGPSEGYWSRLLANEKFSGQMTPDEKVMYETFAATGHMELTRKAFDAIWNHFSDPRVKQFISDLYKRAGLNTPFDTDPNTKRSKGSDLLKAFGVVSNAIAPAPQEAMTVGWNHDITAKYVGRTGDAIGIVASTRMRIEYMIQHLHSKQGGKGWNVKGGDGFTPLERIYLVNSLLTHHAVDVPKEKAWFEYHYDPEEHVRWTLSQLFPDAKESVIDQTVKDLDRAFYMIRAGQTGVSNKGMTLRGSGGREVRTKRDLTFSQRIAALVQGKRNGSGYTVYEAMLEGFETAPALGILSPSEYLENMAPYLWEHVVAKAFPGKFASLTHPDIFASGEEHGRIGVTGAGRTSILGRLKWAYDNMNGKVSKSEHEVARLVGDAIASISAMRVMNQRGGDLAPDEMSKALRDLYKTPAGPEMVPMILAHWADNVADQCGRAGQVFEYDGAEVSRILGEAPNKWTEVYKAVRTKTDEVRALTAAKGREKSGIDAFVLTSAQLRDIARIVWSDVRGALSNSPVGQIYLRMASIVLASERAFGMEIRMDGSGKNARPYMRLWDGTFRDRKSGELSRILEGSILSRPEQSVATPQESINENGELITPSSWANFIGLEFLDPSLAATLAEAMAEDDFFREKVHDVAIPQKPLETTDEERERLESLGAMASRALGRIDVHESVVASLRGSFDEDGTLLLPQNQAHLLQGAMTGFAGEIKKFIKQMGKLLLGASVIGGVSFLPYAMGISDVGTSMDLLLAAPVIGASVHNFGKLLTKAREAFEGIYTGVMNKLPILGELVVNGTVAAYKTAGSLLHLSPYESVGPHSGEYRIWKGGRAHATSVPITAGHLAELTPRGGFSTNERSRKMHRINDIAAPLVLGISEGNAINLMRLEQGIKQLKGLSIVNEKGFFDGHEFLPKTEGMKDYYWEVQNRKLALQYVAEELLTGKVFDLQFVWDGERFVPNKEIRMDSPEMAGAVTKYGDKAKAYAIYEALFSIKQFFLENYRRQIEEALRVESARIPTDEGDAASKTASIDRLTALLEEVSSGGHLFPVGLDGGLWAEQSALSVKAGSLGVREHVVAERTGTSTGAMNFTRLLVETALQRDEIISTSPSAEEKKAIEIEAMMLFINQGGRENSEIESMQRIGGGAGTEIYRLLNKMLRRRVRLNTLKGRHEKALRDIEGLKEQLAASPITIGNKIAKMIAAMEKRAAAMELNIKEVRSDLLNARMEVEKHKGLPAAIERAYVEMESAFSRANRLAPTRARLTAWDPAAAREFIDLTLIANGNPERSTLDRPLHSYLSSDIEQDLSGMFAAFNDQIFEKTVHGVYAQYVYPMMKSKDRRERNSAMKFLRWANGNFNYKSFAQSIDMSKLMKGEEVSLEIVFEETGTPLGEDPDNPKPKRQRRRNVRMRYVGKRNGRYEFEYHTPVGTSHSTVDPVTRTISGIFKQQGDEVGIDLGVAPAPYFINKTAKVLDVKLAVEDRIMGSLGARSFGRTLEGALGEGWGRKYQKAMDMSLRSMLTIMNIGAGVAYLTFNPASAIRNIAYPAKQMIVGGGWVHRKKNLEELRAIADDTNDRAQLETIADVLNSLPIFMFDFLQKGVGETGTTSIGSLKKNIGEGIRLLEMQADAMIYAEKNTKKILARNPGLVMTPMEKDMYIRQMAAEEFTKNVATESSKSKEFALNALGFVPKVAGDVLNAGYKLFSAAEQFNRTSATVTYLLKARSFLDQDFSMSLDGSDTIPYRLLPREIRREIVREYALKARREDERVNFDYSQPKRPAYMRHAAGQIFTKFATFTQAAYIWRKRDMQAMKRDWRLLRSGQMRQNGKVITVTQALKEAAVPFRPHKTTAGMVDHSVLISPAYMLPGVWSEVIDTIMSKNYDVDKIGTMEQARKRQEIFKQINAALSKNGMPAMDLHSFKPDEFARGARMSVVWLTETLMSVLFHYHLGLLREPVSEFVSAFIDLISFFSGNWWDDEEAFYVTGKDGERMWYDPSVDPRVMQAKRRMRDDLLRRLSFSSPIGGLYLSKLVQFFGDMVTDPMVAGEYYYDEGDKTNDLLSIFSLRGLGPLASLLRSVFLAEVESVVDNEYTGREFGERGEGEKLLDALDLGKPNWARTNYRRELEGAKQAALRESYKESDRVYVMRARDAINRMNNEFSLNTVFGLKNLSMAERTNIMNDLVRVQKAVDAVGPDGDEKYYDNAIGFYEKKLSEILTGAISKRQLAALEPVLGSRYDALYGKYSGLSTKALPEHVKASVNEWASAMLKDKILRWKQYYNTYVNQ